MGEKEGLLDADEIYGERGDPAHLPEHISGSTNAACGAGGEEAGGSEEVEGEGMEKSWKVKPAHGVLAAINLRPSVGRKLHGTRFFHVFQLQMALYQWEITVSIEDELC